MQPLLDASIGIECMDTRAAARAYNVLMNENRMVVAALSRWVRLILIKTFNYFKIHTEGKLHEHKRGNQSKSC